MVTTYGDKIRAKLDKKIFLSAAFDPKTVTIIKKTTPIYNNEDEIISYTASSTSVVAVPYDLKSHEFSPQSWGKVIQGDGQIAFRYDTDVDVEDIVRIEARDYKVVSLDPNYLKDSVVKICTLSVDLDEL